MKMRALTVKAEGSDPTTMIRTVNLLSASHKQKQASILVMNGLKEGKTGYNSCLAKE